MVDADGQPIRIGSVLQEVGRECRGVVVEIGRTGAYSSTPGFCVGDISIHQGAGSYRVTNRYSAWRHIPHNAQTYDERLRSWMLVPYDHGIVFNPELLSKDTGRCMDGILALLPDGAIDEIYGPYPNCLEDTLAILKNYLETIDKGNKS